MFDHEALRRVLLNRVSCFPGDSIIAHPRKDDKNTLGEIFSRFTHGASRTVYVNTRRSPFAGPGGYFIKRFAVILHNTSRLRGFQKFFPSKTRDFGAIWAIFVPFLLCLFRLFVTGQAFVQYDEGTLHKNYRLRLLKIRINRRSDARDVARAAT